MLFFAFKSMLQTDSVQTFDLDFPPPPTLGEFAFALTLGWLIVLTMILVGAYGLYRSNNGLIQLLALMLLALGFGLCFILGLGFTLNIYHRFAWSEDNPNINRWINICLGLMILGTAPLFFRIGRKIGKRGGKDTQPNAN
jgi:hypothetical protein